MTYFGFLAVFLGIPIAVLLVIARNDARRGRHLPPSLSGIAAWIPLVAHSLIALLYTTPWDNYLVATRVWWYEPELVTGFLIGYVPIEEYIFFVLQPLLTGLWLMFVARRLPVTASAPAQPRRFRALAVLVAGLVWLLAALRLASGEPSGTYLGLLLVWALLPVIVQLAYGADILWQHRRLLFWALVPTSLYLGSADALAIDGGTWTINPEQSVNVLIGGVLPLEEALFFLLTNLLIVLGNTLVLASASWARLPRILRRGARPTDTAEHPVNAA